MRASALQTENRVKGAERLKGEGAGRDEHGAGAKENPKLPTPPLLPSTPPLFFSRSVFASMHAAPPHGHTNLCRIPTREGGGERERSKGQRPNVMLAVERRRLEEGCRHWPSFLILNWSYEHRQKGRDGRGPPRAFVCVQSLATRAFIFFLLGLRHFFFAGISHNGWMYRTESLHDECSD
mmetsp:Transcript_32068/g.63569  ORF Transcript_32068/g.63569 Transcript_32068/m.63569 type:complete len:180 (+) Transcript_32068:2421-2960(+)